MLKNEEFASMGL